MLVHKRSLAAIVAAAALAVAILMFATPSSGAAPYVHAPTLSVSTTSPCAGGPLTVTGTDFVPGSTVHLTLSGFGSLGSVVVNASGGFTITVTLPAGVFGTHQIVATGPPTAHNPNTASATVHIRDCVTPPPSSPPVSVPSVAVVPPVSRPGPPSVTGLDIFGMAAVALILLGGGGAAVYFGRRRRGAA